MALLQHAGKLIGPPNDLYRVTICRCFNGRPEIISAANRHRKMNPKIREQPHQLRRAARGSIDHIQNTGLGIAGSRLSILDEISKFWAYRKPEHLDFTRRDSCCPQDGGTLFVRNEEVIGGAAVPGCVDGD